MVSQKILNTRNRLLARVEAAHGAQVQKRKDTAGKMMNVLISERRVKAAAKYKIADIPHPFTTREEYERSLQMPLGEDWNASNVVKNNTKPEILTRAGRVIEPIARPRTNPAAVAAAAAAQQQKPNQNNKVKGGSAARPQRKPLK